MSEMTGTQLKVLSLELDGQDALGLFESISLFENIFLGGVIGTLTIIDSDSVDFIQEYDLEFIEEITFSFENAMGELIEFEGYMNGISDEVAKEKAKMYSINFSSKSVRENERVFINRAFRNEAPESIAQDMIEKLGSTVEPQDKGEPLNWTAGNRKPLDVIKYVLSHGVLAEKSSHTGDGEQKGEVKGTSGFLCWETRLGYRFCSMDTMINDQPYELHTDYYQRIARQSASIEDQQKSILKYEFPQIGDAFKKMRSGAMGSNFTSFDMDTGKVTQFEYDADSDLITEKARKYLSGITRQLVRAFNNEKHENTCVKAQADTGDQSRKYLAQGIARANTFSDTQGRLTLPPNYNIHAGDHIEIKIPKRRLSEAYEAGYSDKHTGKYIIAGVGQFFQRDGNGYTLLSVIRTSTQLDDSTAQ